MMLATMYLRILGSRIGSQLRVATEPHERRFYGRPEFLLESGAEECYPYGTVHLSKESFALLKPKVALHYLEEDTTNSLTEIAVDLVLRHNKACSAEAPHALLFAHTCMSEDVSTSTSNRMIEVLDLACAHSFSVLGTVASAWTHAIECCRALHFGDGPAPTALLVAGEKWMSPFSRTYGDLFAMSDGMTIALLTQHAPVGEVHLRVKSHGTRTSAVMPHWLLQPIAINEPDWLRAIESGLEELLSEDDFKACTNSLILGPALGIDQDRLQAHAPMFSTLVQRTTHSERLPGHFGSADPFIRLQDVLQRNHAGVVGRPVILWSVGPEGDISILTGDIRL